MNGEQSACGRIPWEDFDLGTLEETLEAANHDSDVASCIVLGDSLEESKAMFFVVKGSAAVIRVRELLVAEGYLTPGKPVIDPTAEATAHGIVVDGQVFDPLGETGGA